MKKVPLKAVARGVKASVQKHSPEILTGIGIAGMITATVMAVRATPKALILVNERKEELETDNLEPFELVKTAWFCYIPSAVTGVLSIACIVGASSVNHRRNAALATAYTLSESALKEYQDKVVETIGEHKEQLVRDSIAKDRVEKNPVQTREVIMTDRGDSLCYDSIGGRYFKSDINKIRKAVNDLNRQMLDNMYVSLNDFYYEIGLDPTKGGEDLGWNVIKGFVEVSFSSQLASDGTPCLVLNYSLAPVYDYTNY